MSTPGAIWSISGLPVSLDRRRFVIGLAAGLATVKLVPATARAAVAPGLAVSGETIGDWSIDDVWGLYPRYSAPIGFGRPRAAVPPAPADPQLAY